MRWKDGNITTTATTSTTITTTTTATSATTTLTTTKPVRTYGCGNTHLTPTDFPGANNWVPAKNGVCGTTRPTTSYRTTGSQVTVELVNHGGPTYADFQLLLTTFYRPGQNGKWR